jgi:hypothetical protein
MTRLVEHSDRPASIFHVARRAEADYDLRQG